METVLINLQGISKQYGSRKIMDEFSYEFLETGFYLLFGESGCGKTTLLNILSGMTGFDGGTVSIGAHTFEGIVEWDQIRSLVGYVTQNCFFIDYLTVGEQLELTGCERSRIPTVLEKFNLSGCERRYPSQLSGGEKQRLSIVQALLQNKKILLLDEPTASLDEENKFIVWDTLSMVSREILVICSSHDEAAKSYAGSVIDFTRLDRAGEEAGTQQRAERSDIPAETIPQNPPALYPYFKKWFSYKGRERKSTFGILLIYFVAFLALLAGDFPNHKLAESAEHVYRINQCAVTVEDNGKQLLGMLENTPGVLDIGMAYNGSAPDITMTGEGHDTLMYGVLPSNSEAFALKERIAYGGYFDSADQVLLSAEKAAEYGEPSELVGHTVTLNLYDGYRRFEIAGVFEPFSDTDAQYMRQGLNQYANDSIYLSSAYTMQFQDEAGFNWNNQRTYVVYFTDYAAMREFADSASAQGMWVAESQVEVGISEQFLLLFGFLLPFALLIVFCSILFYYQTRRMELSYNKHLLLMYDYLGFGKREIRNCYIRGYFAENLRLLAAALFPALLLGFIVNLINEHFQLVAFRIFTFNPVLIALYLCFNILVSLLISSISVSKINRSKWYELFMEKRDLL